MKDFVQCIIRVSYKDEDFETTAGHKHAVSPDDHITWLPFCIASAVNQTMNPQGMRILASAVIELAGNFDTDQDDIHVQAFRDAAFAYIATLDVETRNENPT